ncbi:hypothetical protein KM925_25325 [Priestia megaterium]|uniref:hypothetical protein n=1 Tax=Priestia megaterium TaxID=1404 RepID=UPI001C24562B|nr:hypothetical protein [Priestia megaterium]MBU8589217.1 hypothetical protein [Priestia megaterium]
MSFDTIMSSPFFLPFVLPFLGVIITAYTKVTPLSRTIFDGNKGDFNLGFDFAIAAHIIFIVEVSNMLKNAGDSKHVDKLTDSILIGTGLFLILSIIFLEVVKKWGIEEYQVKVEEPNGQSKDIQSNRYNTKGIIISWTFGLFWSIWVVFYAISVGEY